MKLFFLVHNNEVEARWCRFAESVGAEVVKKLELAEPTEAIGLVHISSVAPAEIDGLCQRLPALKWIALSDVPNDREGLSLLGQGFRGYLNAYPTASVFAEVLAVVARNDIWAGPALTQKLLKQFLQQQSGGIDEVEPPQENYQLTERESGVLDLLLVGCSNKEIARELNITERTVKSHVTSILKKTETKDRLTLILKLNKQAV